MKEVRYLRRLAADCLNVTKYVFTESDYDSQQLVAWQQVSDSLRQLADGKYPVPFEQYTTNYKDLANLLEVMRPPVASISNNHRDFSQKVDTRAFVWNISNVVTKADGHFEDASFAQAMENGQVWNLLVDAVYVSKTRCISVAYFSFHNITEVASVHEQGMLLLLPQKNSDEGTVPMGVGIFPFFLDEGGIRTFDVLDEGSRCLMKTKEQWYAFYKIGQLDDQSVMICRLTDEFGKRYKRRHARSSSVKDSIALPHIIPNFG